MPEHILQSKTILKCGKSPLDKQESTPSLPLFVPQCHDFLSRQKRDGNTPFFYYVIISHMANRYYLLHSAGNKSRQATRGIGSRVWSSFGSWFKFGRSPPDDDRPTQIGRTLEHRATPFKTPRKKFRPSESPCYGPLSRIVGPASQMLTCLGSQTARPVVKSARQVLPARS